MELRLDDAIPCEQKVITLLVWCHTRLFFNLADLLAKRFRHALKAESPACAIHGSGKASVYAFPALLFARRLALNGAHKTLDDCEHAVFVLTFVLALFGALGAMLVGTPELSCTESEASGLVHRVSHSLACLAAWPRLVLDDGSTGGEPIVVESRGATAAGAEGDEDEEEVESHWSTVLCLLSPQPLPPQPL